MWTSPWRVYLDKDGKPILKEEDGAVLWAGESERKPQDEAIRLGLAEKDGTPIKPGSKGKREAKRDDDIG